MKWVSYTRSISSRIGEENPSNTIAEQNERIARYLKKRGCSVSEKYSDRKRTAEATEGFDKLVQDGMARKFDAVVVDSIFRCGRTLPFAIEALQRTFYPLGIQFAVVECADELDEEIRALTKQASEKTYIGGLTKECVDVFVSKVYLYDDQTMKIEFNCEDVIRRALEKYI